MARSSLLLHYFSGSGSFRSIFFIIPTTLALTTALCILFSISTTSNLFTRYHPPDPSFLGLNSPFGSSTFSPLTRQTVSISFHNHSKTPFQFQVPQIVHLGEGGLGSQRPLEPRSPPDGLVFSASGSYLLVWKYFYRVCVFSNGFCVNFTVCVLFTILESWNLCYKPRQKIESL